MNLHTNAQVLELQGETRSETNRTTETLPDEMVHARTTPDTVASMAHKDRDQWRPGARRCSGPIEDTAPAGRVQHQLHIILQANADVLLGNARTSGDQVNLALQDTRNVRG